MNIKDLLLEKGFVEGIDYSILVDGSLSALDKTRDVEQVIHHPEETKEVFQADGTSYNPPQYETTPAWDETVIVQETYKEVLPSVDELKGECVSRSDIAMLVNEYLAGKEALRTDDDSINISEGSIVRWDFANIPAPSMQELYSIISIAKDKSSSEQFKKEKIQKGKEAREVCERVLDLVAGYNLDRALTMEQITQMQTTFADAEKALRAGRPTQAKQAITAIVVDEVLVTQEMKGLCLELLAKYQKH